MLQQAALSAEESVGAFSLCWLERGSGQAQQTSEKFPWFSPARLDVILISGRFPSVVGSGCAFRQRSSCLSFSLITGVAANRGLLLPH